MNLLERSLVAVAPGIALGRQEARAKMEALRAKGDRARFLMENRADVVSHQHRVNHALELHQRLYNIAQFNETMPATALLNGNPNSDVIGAMVTAKKYVRDVMMNDPVAQHARDVRCDSIVGEGIQPRADSHLEDADAKDQIDETVMTWFYRHFESTDIDVNGQHDIYGLQFAAEQQKATDGEVLWIDVWNSKTDLLKKGLTHPLQYDVRSCDWLAWTVNSSTDAFGNVWPVIGGIEFDPVSKRRRAYWVFTQDPAKGASDAIRIDAKFVCHDADVQFLGQFRGWSVFSPVVQDFHDVRNAFEGGIKRVQADAALTAIVELPADAQEGEEPNLGTPGDFRYGSYGEFGGGMTWGIDGFPTTGGGMPVEWLRPGQISKVRAGTKIHTINPTPSSVFDPAIAHGFRRIAMAAGQTYESISLDYGKVNFVSGRLAKGPVARMNRRLQWRWVIRKGATMWADFITGGYTMEIWGFDRWTIDQIRPDEVTWTFPSADSADPLGEANTEAKLMMMGKLGHGEMLRRDGKDPSQHYRAMARDKAQAAAVGIDLDKYIFSSAGGQPADSAKNSGDDEGSGGIDAAGSSE